MFLCKFSASLKPIIGKQYVEVPRSVDPFGHLAALTDDIWKTIVIIRLDAAMKDHVDAMVKEKEINKHVKRFAPTMSYV